MRVHEGGGGKNMMVESRVCWIHVCRSNMMKCPPDYRPTSFLRRGIPLRITPQEVTKGQLGLNPNVGGESHIGGLRSRAKPVVEDHI